MGLADEEFWNLTWGLFERLFERWKAAQARADRRSGEVVAMLYNAHRDTKKDPKGINWLDVFPEHKPPAKPQTEDEMFEAMLMWSRATDRAVPRA